MQWCADARWRHRQVLTLAWLGLMVVTLAVGCGGDDEPGATVEEAATAENAGIVDSAEAQETAGPGSLTVLGDETEGFIDRINDIVVPRPQSEPLAVTGAEAVRIQGWAVDLSADGLAAGVVVVVLDQGDVVEEIVGEYGEARSDIAEYLGPAFLESGYTAEIPAGTLPLGTYTLELRVLAADGEGYYPATPQMRADIRVAGAPQGTESTPNESPDTGV